VQSHQFHRFLRGGPDAGDGLPSAYQLDLTEELAGAHPGNRDTLSLRRPESSCTSTTRFINHEEVVDVLAGRQDSAIRLVGKMLELMGGFHHLRRVQQRQAFCHRFIDQFPIEMMMVREVRSVKDGSCVTMAMVLPF